MTAPQPSPLVADTLAKAADDRLIPAAERLTRRGRYAGFALVVMFAAGVWWDGRWFPTMVIPLGFCAAWNWLGAQFRYEAARRGIT